MPDEVRRGLREALKTVAVALKEVGVPFALAGSYGLWARGGPEPDHDVDFLVAEEDAPRVMERLAEHGLQVVQPPEDWLFKIFIDQAMVDVLFRTAGVPVTRKHFDGVDEIEVESVAMPVLSATTLMIDKMLAMEEHSCNLTAALPAARAVREQINWDHVREAVEENPYASAFLYLLDRLRITE
ncbi:MAG: nucleotidyltransferase domain-containing protein [Nocardioides sp.]